MMGRPRKPAELKKAQGTFQPCRNPGKEPNPKKIFSLPAPGPAIKGRGIDAWKTVGPELIHDQLLTEADILAFEQLCIHWGDAHNLYDDLTLVGMGKKTERIPLHVDKNNIHTYNAMEKEFKACTALMIQFGMTPASRNHFSVKKDDGPTDEEKKMEALLEG
jgi:P27 family predicted phage terminase small subunit